MMTMVTTRGGVQLTRSKEAGRKRRPTSTFRWPKATLTLTRWQLATGAPTATLTLKAAGPVLCVDVDTELGMVACGTVDGSVQVLRGALELGGKGKVGRWHLHPAASTGRAPLPPPYHRPTTALPRRSCSGSPTASRWASGRRSPSMVRAPTVVPEAGTHAPRTLPPPYGLAESRWRRCSPAARALLIQERHTAVAQWRRRRRGGRQRRQHAHPLAGQRRRREAPRV